MIVGSIVAIACLNDGNIGGAIMALAIGGLLHGLFVCHPCGGEND